MDLSISFYNFYIYFRFLNFGNLRFEARMAMDLRDACLQASTCCLAMLWHGVISLGYMMIYVRYVWEIIGKCGCVWKLRYNSPWGCYIGYGFHDDCPADGCPPGKKLKENELRPANENGGISKSRSSMKRLQFGSDHFTLNLACVGMFGAFHATFQRCMEQVPSKMINIFVLVEGQDLFVLLATALPTCLKKDYKSVELWFLGPLAKCNDRPIPFFIEKVILSDLKAMVLPKCAPQYIGTPLENQGSALMFPRTSWSTTAWGDRDDVRDGFGLRRDSRLPFSLWKWSHHIL